MIDVAIEVRRVERRERLANAELLSVSRSGELALLLPRVETGNPYVSYGTLAVVSGRIAKQSPQAMTVRTPSAQLAVRGTDFVVAVGE